MVQLMLEGLNSGAHGNFEIFHVNARFSDTMDQIGQTGVNKLWRALQFSAQAIFLRFKEGVDTFYYIPAPPKKGAMIRDWIILGACRPFFPKVILHWHAVGLGKWTQDHKNDVTLRSRLASWLNIRILGGHFRSLVLTTWGISDVTPFQAKNITVVSNGIIDPCPNFDSELLPKRLDRRKKLQKALTENSSSACFQLCFLGHCTAEKGLWDAMSGAALVCEQLRVTSPALTLKLRIAGEFPSQQDRECFTEHEAKLRQQFHLPEGWVEHVGFVSGKTKETFLKQADCLCFPTKYCAESFGLVAVEALAFGIPPVTSDWRMLPELMAKAKLPVTRTGDPQSLADGIIAAIGRDSPIDLRHSFLTLFTADAHLAQLSSALEQ